MKSKRSSWRSTPKQRTRDDSVPVPDPVPGRTGRIEPERSGSHGTDMVLWGMIGMSGCACLVYQILWMRQTGLLFGSTSQAAALTLAVFFSGLSAGGWYWGQRSGKLRSPLRVYAWLEAGIALAGFAVLLAPLMVRQVYPMVYQMDGRGTVLLVFKAACTLVMVFPPSFLMGGTLPVLGQAVIRGRSAFGRTTALIYAVNTLGAAGGAFAAGFLLIWLAGIRMTCAVAMVASLAAAVLAWRLSGQSRFQSGPVSAMAVADGQVAPHSKSDRADKRAAGVGSGLARGWITGLAFVSGFNLLALEVVWTRMLAQVHENSVYSFATVLIVVLVCLSLGAWLASRLARRATPANQAILWLAALGGLSLAVSPLLHEMLTDGSKMLETDFSFGTYVLRLFGTAFASIGPACLLLGTVFPCLMKGEERFIRHAGESIGVLSAINTLGAILGSLAAGFLFLEWLGLWRTIQVISGIYLIVAILAPVARVGAGMVPKIVAGVTLLLLPLLHPHPEGEVARPDALGGDMTLVERWEGSDGTVTVVRGEQGDLSIRINSNYSLGSSSAYGPQAFQARIPLFAFPFTESVFFLGMGTGTTAGEALNRNDFPGIHKVVACELSPNVVAASRKYFTGKTDGFDFTNGLYRDTRAKVIIGDGRNHLLADRERYSMINADLFLPYRCGTGNLYSREHFTVALERLRPGGVFVQWLPLYQMSEREFGVIARTMASVFPQVSLWRGNFQPGAEIAALVGHADMTPLPASTLDVENDKRLAVEGATHLDMQRLMLPINAQTVLFFYGGNVSRAADLFEPYPMNTDDRPVIEFGTPRSLHRQAGSGKPQFLEARFAKLVAELQKRTPPEIDPILSLRSPSSRNLSLAGSAFHSASIAGVHGDEDEWVAQWQKFLALWLENEPTR